MRGERSARERQVPAAPSGRSPGEGAGWEAPAPRSSGFESVKGIAGVAGVMGPQRYRVKWLLFVTACYQRLGRDAQPAPKCASPHLWAGRLRASKAWLPHVPTDI